VNSLNQIAEAVLLKSGNIEEKGALEGGAVVAAPAKKSKHT